MPVDWIRLAPKGRDSKAQANGLGGRPPHPQALKAHGSRILEGTFGFLTRRPKPAGPNRPTAGTAAGSRRVEATRQGAATTNCMFGCLGEPYDIWQAACWRIPYLVPSKCANGGLKGRDKGLSRPFRAWEERSFLTQAFDLGYAISPLRGCRQRRHGGIGGPGCLN